MPDEVAYMSQAMVPLIIDLSDAGILLLLLLQSGRAIPHVQASAFRGAGNNFL